MNQKDHKVLGIDLENFRNVYKWIENKTKGLQGWKRLKSGHNKI